MSNVMVLFGSNCEVPGLKGTGTRRVFAVTKRLADLVLGMVASVLCLPLLVVCIILIKISNRGAGIYSQTRVGKGGKLFKMYKLRTMVRNAESSTGPVWASADDPRVLPVCRWMRRSHIDELPQLLNVLKGEMSLIGPRPERPEILNTLEESYPDINRRLAVRPGITGLAQVRNGYDLTVQGVKHKLDADLEYITNRSRGMEIVIFVATLPKFYDKAAH